MKKLFILITVFLLFVSCGGSSNENGEDQNQLNVENFFSRYLTTLCTAASTCTSGLVNQSNLANCPSLLKNSTTPFAGFNNGEMVIFEHKYQMLKSAEEMGWVKVDMVQAETCFLKITEMQPCDPFSFHLLDVAECAAVFIGTKPLKQDCTQNEVCSNGWCKMSGSSCNGSCSEYKQAGQPCKSNDRCAPGYECSSTGCVQKTLSGPNEPCISNSNCKSTLFCYIESGDAYGTCLNRKGLNAPCTMDDECALGLGCIANLCSGSKVRNNAGESCGLQPKLDENEEDVVIECNRFSKLECNSSNYCAPLPTYNMECASDCDDTANLFCNETYHRCDWQLDAGSPCTSNKQCKTLYCARVTNPDGTLTDVSVCRVPECLTVVNE